MEYILTEILKNAFRATVEHHRYHYHRQHSTDGSGPIAHTHHEALPLPPVSITIVTSPRVPGITTGRPATLSLRIRDHGGGVTPADMERIFSYAFTTAGRCSSGRPGRSRSARSGDGDGGGPYAAQNHVGAGGVAFFGEITGKGIETGLGTIAGLGFGLPMSRLYAQ